MTSNSAVDDIDHRSLTIVPSEENRGIPNITHSSFSIQHETNVKSLPQGEDTEKQQFMFVPEERDETRPVIRDDRYDTGVKSGVTHDSSSVGSLNPEIPKPVLTTELVSDPTKPNQMPLEQLDSATSAVRDEATETSENMLKDYECCTNVSTDKQRAVTSEISCTDVKSQHSPQVSKCQRSSYGISPIEKDDGISGVSEKDNEAKEDMDVIPYVDSVNINMAGSESLQTSLLDVTDSSLTVSEDRSQSHTTVSLKTEQKLSMVVPQSETGDRHFEIVSMSLAGAGDECPSDDVIGTVVESVQPMATDSKSKVRFKIIHAEEQGTHDSDSSFHWQVRFTLYLF